MHSLGNGGQHPSHDDSWSFANFEAVAREKMPSMAIAAFAEKNDINKGIEVDFEAHCDIKAGLTEKSRDLIRRSHLLSSEITPSNKDIKGVVIGKINGEQAGYLPVADMTVDYRCAPTLSLNVRTQGAVLPAVVVNEELPLEDQLRLVEEMARAVSNEKTPAVIFAPVTNLRDYYAIKAGLKEDYTLLSPGEQSGYSDYALELLRSHGGETYSWEGKAQNPLFDYNSGLFLSRAPRLANTPDSSVISEFAQSQHGVKISDKEQELFNKIAENQTEEGPQLGLLLIFERKEGTSRALAQQCESAQTPAMAMA